MAKVRPYHSSNLDEPNVWHDYDNCPAGSLIPAENWVAGKGNMDRRCELCEGMD